MSLKLPDHRSSLLICDCSVYPGAAKIGRSVPSMSAAESASTSRQPRMLVTVPLPTSSIFVSSVSWFHSISVKPTSSSSVAYSGTAPARCAVTLDHAAPSPSDSPCSNSSVHSERSLGDQTNDGLTRIVSIAPTSLPSAGLT